ncbi:PLP-dependent cysteine synthase family protein [Halomicrococcus sp. NG-SE-24]|uniref:PLP-dependent cysteine synthase family protein n=1 Tax=Halomicrococcus sp. NG-SE-24 TaxID=3436928 RepID=UPI003D9A094D
MTTHSEPLTSVLEAVGETPLVEVHAAPPEVPVYAKHESFNPGASVKDRIGKAMLEGMLERGDVEPGGTVIEPTAGNTGIAIAMAAGELELEAVCVVPERFSAEKQTLMDALGATLVNTPTDEGMSGAIDRAHDIAADRDDAVIPQQFENPLNVEAHYRTTGPEIWEALDGEIGAIVTGCGTAGTLTGMAQYVREREPDVFIGAVEPEGSLYAQTQGREVDSGEYKVEGIGTKDPSTRALFDADLVDEVVRVGDREVHEEIARLAHEESKLVGTSSGASSLGALSVARRIADGDLDVPHDNVVTVFPDSSERYLSKGIYDEFEAWEG